MKPVLVEHDITCAWCGDSWRDIHPDFPGAKIWCGDCKREHAAECVCEECNTKRRIAKGYCPHCGGFHKLIDCCE